MSRTRKQRTTLRPTGFLTPREASRFLGCTDMGVKLRLYAGKLKGFKAPNGYWWVDETDLRKELKAKGLSAPRRAGKASKPIFSVQPVEINVQAAKEFGLRVQSSGNPYARITASGNLLTDSGLPLQDMPLAPDNLTPDDAARILGVTAGLVRKWIQWGKLNATKSSSGHLRIPTKEINTILEARRSPQPMVYFVGKSGPSGTLVSGVAGRLGHNIRVVSTLTEAVKDLSLNPASLLLLDLDDFPDSWSLVRMIRGTTVYGTPRILLLTKGPMLEKAERMAMRLGVNGCLSQSVSEAVLCSEIKTQLRRPGV